MELQHQVSTLASKLGAILADKRLSITTAESCTGGGVSYALTDTSGSSRYIDRCFVTYSNDAKQALLGVTASTLETHGAVSKETVSQMCEGAAKAAKADLAIAISGVAGPTGGSPEKPVGTVWFGFNFSGETHTFSCVFSGNRAKVREQAIVFALEKSISLLNS